jgi:xanthine dehydrogenase accessory factor
MPQNAFHHATPLLETFLAKLLHEPAVLVEVDSIAGSVPREPGAWMAMFEHTQLGTVGGGHLELAAAATARQLLQAGDSKTSGEVQVTRVALGPSLGQCCGGVVHLRFSAVGPADIAGLKKRLQAAHSPVALFGGGHVGHALAKLLANLPLALTWIDSRDGVFPPDAPSHLVCEHSDPPQRAVASLQAGSMVLIMSFSHAEDLDILAACLLRQREQADLPYIGLIGSKTKWATFSHRLAARGFSPPELAHVTCPIGIAGISRKEPEVIAVAVAAQLLQVLQTTDHR